MKRKMKLLFVGWLVYNLIDEQMKAKKNLLLVAEAVDRHDKVMEILVEHISTGSTRTAREKLEALGANLEFERITKDL